MNHHPHGHTLQSSALPSGQSTGSMPVCRHGRSLERAMLAALLAGAAVLSACEPKAPKPETSAQPTATTQALPGVKPHDESSAPASDRPGAVAIGAVEAGQSSGGANESHAAPTAGDGTASGSASSPAR